MIGAGDTSRIPENSTSAICDGHKRRSHAQRARSQFNVLKRAICRHCADVEDEYQTRQYNSDSGHSTDPSVK
jgi:hypothetical protein